MVFRLPIVSWPLAIQPLFWLIPCLPTSPSPHGVHIAGPWRIGSVSSASIPRAFARCLAWRPHRGRPEPSGCPLSSGWHTQAKLHCDRQIAFGCDSKTQEIASRPAEDLLIIGIFYHYIYLSLCFFTTRSDGRSWFEECKICLDIPN